MVSGGGAPAIGIDLGTTYSCVAVWKHDRIQIITNDQGNRTTPSCVSFTNAERLVGDGAKNQIARNPANTVFKCMKQVETCLADANMNKGSVDEVILVGAAVDEIESKKEYLEFISGLAFSN
ncbi:hypothetical protein L2E82_11541 [Cichorium intybus]|uniref:Uncharacterized protein n=1 Tax=Cichorium intybus TaxID=13427 RepID=A0ACB9GD37_CICIN|nr:hypothetical protein L2E82_11541 [Cichorium intybus]